jgi:hypothetical protein
MVVCQRCCFTGVDPYFGVTRLTMSPTSPLRGNSVRSTLGELHHDVGPQR